MQDVDEQILGPTVYDDILFAPLNYGIPKAQGRSPGEGCDREIEYRVHSRERSSITYLEVKRRKWP